MDGLKDDPFYRYDRTPVSPPTPAWFGSSDAGIEMPVAEPSQTPGSSSGGRGLFPFRGIDASAAGVAKVKFAYGTVGNASPTFGGNPVNPTSGEATVSNGDKVYLDATVDGTGVVTALIATRASSVPADTSTHKYKLLFEVAVSGGAVTSIGQSVNTNLSLFLCNGNAIWEVASS